MGRALDGELFELSNLETNVLSLDEFALVAETYFTVPISQLHLMQSKTFIIPGLWTPKVSVKNKYLDQINIFPVKLNFVNVLLLDVSKTCYVVRGRDTVADLCAMVHTKLELDSFARIQISLEGKELPGGMQMLTIYKNHISKDGFIELDCKYATIPTEGGGNRNEPSSDNNDDKANAVHTVQNEDNSTETIKLDLKIADPLKKKSKKFVLKTIPKLPVVVSLQKAKKKHILKASPKSRQILLGVDPVKLPIDI